MGTHMIYDLRIFLAHVLQEALLPLSTRPGFVFFFFSQETSAPSRTEARGARSKRSGERLTDLDSKR